jgi:hypothetical protein
MFPRTEQLAAQRFVNYWESRREVFGPDKFVLRMTLSEALCDDITAIDACIARPLPRSDASGRQLLFMESLRHTREGYTSESMVSVVCLVYCRASRPCTRFTLVRLCHEVSHTVESLVL